MNMETEKQARKDALDLAHSKARDEYFKAFENCYRNFITDLRDEDRALAAADGAARRAYVETHCAVYKEICNRERAKPNDGARRPDKVAASQ